MNMRFLNSEGFGASAGVPRSTNLLCSLRSALSQTESKVLTYERLTQITGQPPFRFGRKDAAHQFSGLTTDQRRWQLTKGKVD